MPTAGRNWATVCLIAGEDVMEVILFVTIDFMTCYLKKKFYKNKKNTRPAQIQ